MENNKPIVEIKDLYVQFHSDDAIIHAVNGVDLTIREGETLGLVGETGAGKTTIARAILGIVAKPQGKITQGEILFEGEDILKYHEKDMRSLRGNQIAMIFQDPMTALNPIERVGEQIEEAIGLHNDISHAEAIERAMQMLELVGIPRERYFEYPHQFSGGMKQRVVIAMALACNPKLLLADEPTTALDVTIQAQVLKMMRELKEKLNTAVLMITHDLGVVASICQKVAVIYAGEIVEYGTLEQIFDHPTHPYTLGLFGSLPKLDSTEKRLKPIRGMMPDPSVEIQGCKFADRCEYATDECRARHPDIYTTEDGHQIRCVRAGKEGA